MWSLLRHLGVSCLVLFCAAGLAHAVDIDLKNPDGSKTTLKSNNAGSASVSLSELLGGEHVGATEAEGYFRVTGALVRTTTAMTGVTTNTTSAAFTIPSGGKTPLAQVSGTGAVTATLTLFGDNDSTADNGILLCTITLSATTKHVKGCDDDKQFATDYPYYYATSANVTGTGATVEFSVSTGIAAAGSGGAGGAGDASAANQTTMITALQLIDNAISGTGVNVSQINGVAPLMGAGVTGTGSPRVTIATDQAALTVTDGAGALNVICDSGCSGGTTYTHDEALTVGTTVGVPAVGRASATKPTDVNADNDTVLPWHLRSGAFVSQPSFAGVLATAGNGVAGTGVQRVTEATDSQLSADIALIKAAVELIDNDQTGATMLHRISAGVTEDEHEIKATAGRLLSISATNVNAAVRYLRCANLTAANTTPGTSSVWFGIAIPGSTTGAGITQTFGPSGVAFSVALTCWIVTGQDESDVAEVAANELNVNYTFK